MSKKIKTQMQIVNQSQKICQSMSNLSAVKMMSSKKKLIEIEKQLVTLGGLFHQTHGSLKKNNIFNVLMYSNFGFVGGFNTYNKNKSNSLIIGKKGKGIQLKTLENFFSFFENRQLQDYNFFIMDFFHQKEMEINILSYIKPINEDFIIECSKNQIKEAFFKKFVEYIFYVYTYQENVHRNQVMKSASENSQKWYKDLYIAYNKQRQMSLTQEILLIVSGNI